ncbi:protein LAX PANICLE 2 [Humulus lupulus]|uniref:protein LAX PANICLE 2 n=1 Tax=Humulus lupulus TaxID=3486 RepID=UPI002B408C00|nr:protein LAX PANICLE 2 [Humulus lupulus]
MVPAPNLSKQHHHHHLHLHQNLLLLQKSNDINIISTDNNNPTSTYYGNYDKYTEAAECFSLMMSRATEGYENCSTTESCLGSDLVVATTDPNSSMAEDESRTNSLNEAGSSSKDAHQQQEETMKVDQDHGSWLQLSIGGAGTPTHGHSHNIDHGNHHHHQILEQAARRGSGSGGLMIELDLLPCGGSSTSTRQQAAAGAAAAAAARSSNSNPMFQLGPHGGTAAVSNFGSAATNNFSTTPLMYFQHPGSTSGSSNFPPPPVPHHHLPPHLHHQQEAINWGFRPNLIQYPSSSQLHNTNNNSNIMAASPSCSSSLMMMPQLGSSYFGRQFQLQQPPVVEAAAGPSLDFRVTNPPKRPHSGIWFMLQASQNQAKEPFLPQISKSFLRIRDGSMTVGLLIKYLVNKLRLDSESEIEIRCRGQQVLPMLTLQQVRDNIWGPTVTTLLPDSSSSTTDHLMVLHYARTP